MGVKENSKEMHQKVCLSERERGKDSGTEGQLKRKWVLIENREILRETE